jgi:hypothetical protein
MGSLGVSLTEKSPRQTEDHLVRYVCSLMESSRRTKKHRSTFVNYTTRSKSYPEVIPTVQTGIILALPVGNLVHPQWFWQDSSVRKNSFAKIVIGSIVSILDGGFQTTISSIKHSSSLKVWQISQGIWNHKRKNVSRVNQDMIGS